MNTLRTIAATAFGALALFAHLLWASSAADLATTHGYDAMIGVVGLALICTVLAIGAALCLAPDASDVEAPYTTIVPVQRTLEPTDGKLVLRPGQRVMIVADMPRGEGGRYLKLPSKAVGC